MIPLRDVIPSRTTPWVTMLLIAINVVVFIYELTLDDRSLRQFFDTYGLVPAYFSWLTAFTAIFLHSGWLHIAGNMWSLWIFGDNVEDRMGHGRFLLFYLASGVVSSLFHASMMPGSPMPTIGASGAIAGVLGAYAFAFPRARVLTLVPIFFFFQIIAIPALVLLGIWFAFQFIAGTLSAGGSGGGVAWWAHIGGFVFGFLVMMLFSRRPRSQAEVVG